MCSRSRQGRRTNNTLLPGTILRHRGSRKDEAPRVRQQHKLHTPLSRYSTQFCSSTALCCWVAGDRIRCRESNSFVEVDVSFNLGLGLCIIYFHISSSRTLLRGCCGISSIYGWGRSGFKDRQSKSSLNVRASSNRRAIPHASSSIIKA